MARSLFALDIGTRSVVGIILEEQGGQFHVVDLLIKEHKERSMIDGQIHNILSVASVIEEIKQTLEERHGHLATVSVAAAGRSLKTVEGAMDIDIREQSLLSMEDVNRLELAAVQQAQQKLLAASDLSEEDHYYCVGYSVLHYKLNGETIGSLIDQTGTTATAEVIATFLPRVVVESLLAALKRAGLEMEALTLEPIAAINVLIPPSMRRLNVALVDIGAGTSDIAIAKDNTVTAYGMVPIAGDEITETLSSHYLLDFPLAETAKRQLSSQETVTVQDILGFEQQLPAEEVIEVIRPAVKRLAADIAQEIKRLNNDTAPQAVMVVGGGSMTPDVTVELSQQLDLPENRVAMRGLNALTGVTFQDTIDPSPALVTPIGIAIAANRSPIHYVTVTVNERTVRLFELKELSVGDALLAARITARQLYGKPGLGMTIKLNGELITIPGRHGTPSVIYVNGREAGTKQRIQSGDAITVEFGKDGEHAEARICDICEGIEEVHFYLDGIPLTLKPSIIKNGHPAEPDEQLADRDELVIQQQRTLRSALDSMSDGQWKPLEKVHLTVKLNGQNKALRERLPKYYRGEEEMQLDDLIKNGDIVTTRQPEIPAIEELADELGVPLIETLSVTFNDQPVTIKKQRTAVFVNGQLTADHKTSVSPTDDIEFKSVSEAPVVFSDIFAFTEFRLPTNSASAYRLLRNGKSIRFNEPIFGGDQLEIRFE